MSQLDVEAATRKYFPNIHRAALMLTGNPWDADDLAQETFFVLARSADKFEGRSEIFTWLYGILLNLERRQRRQNAIRQRKMQVFWDNGPQSEPLAPAADTRIEVAEWKNSLWSYVSQLPDGMRETLVLRFSEGLQYDEIASVLDCPIGTVKSRIYNGIGTLRKLVQNDGGTAADLFPNEDVNHAI